MEIDAGVDESVKGVGKGGEVKWVGRYYAAQMSCDCITASS